MPRFASCAAVAALKIQVAELIADTTTYTEGDGITITAGVIAVASNVARKTLTLSQFAPTTSAELLALITNETGSGSLVFGTSPTLTSPVLVTPALGTPASGDLSNTTADGTSPTGFRNIPSNPQAAAYSTVLADAGKSIDHLAADANARTFTIDGAVAYPVGTCISFSNMTANVVTIAISTDTMYLVGAGTTGSRSLAQFGVATARKQASGVWMISGINLT